MDTIIANILKKQGIKDLMPLYLPSSSSKQLDYDGELYGYVKENKFHICNSELADIMRCAMDISRECLCIEKTEDMYVVTDRDNTDGYLLIIDKKNTIIAEGHLRVVFVSDDFWYLECRDDVKSQEETDGDCIVDYEKAYNIKLKIKENSFVTIDSFLEGRKELQAIVCGQLEDEYVCWGKINWDEFLFTSKKDKHKYKIVSWAGNVYETGKCDYVLSFDNRNITFVSSETVYKDFDCFLVIRFKKINNCATEIFTDHGEVLWNEVSQNYNSVHIYTSIKGSNDKNLFIYNNETHSYESIRIPEEQSFAYKRTRYFVLKDESGHYYAYTLKGEYIGKTGEFGICIVEENKCYPELKGLRNIVTDKIMVPPLFSDIQFHEQAGGYTYSVVTMKYGQNVDPFEVKGVFLDTKLIVPIQKLQIKKLDNRWLNIRKNSQVCTLINMASKDIAFEESILTPKISSYKGNSYRAIISEKQSHFCENGELLFSDFYNVKAIYNEDYPALAEPVNVHVHFDNIRDEELLRRWILVEVTQDNYKLYDLETKSFFMSDFVRMKPIGNHIILFYLNDEEFIIYNSIRNEFTEKFDYYESINEDIFMLDGKHSLLCLYDIYDGWILKDESIEEIQLTYERTLEDENSKTELFFLVHFSDKRIAYFSSLAGYIVEPMQFVSIREFKFGYLINNYLLFDLNGQTIYCDELEEYIIQKNDTYNTRYVLYRNPLGFVIIVDNDNSLFVYMGNEVYKDEVIMRRMPQSSLPLFAEDYKQYQMTYIEDWDL